MAPTKAFSIHDVELGSVPCESNQIRALPLRKVRNQMKSNEFLFILNHFEVTFRYRKQVVFQHPSSVLGGKTTVRGKGLAPTYPSHERGNLKRPKKKTDKTTWHSQKKLKA